MVNNHVKNWALLFIPESLHRNYVANTQSYTRWIMGTTSLLVLLVTLFIGRKVSVLTAPCFIKVQFALIAVCNLAGVLFSLSQLERTDSIYDTWYGFAWQVTIILTYVGAGLLGQWLFAYQYLMTSRTLAEELKSRTLAVEDEEGYTDANELDQPEEKIEKQFYLSRKNL